MLNRAKNEWPWRGGRKRWPERMRNGQPWPRLTVITPSYNQGRFIEETILSVLQQGYPNLEYIIIDGGSTDNTVEVIRKYEHSLAYWVSERDRGQSHALNKGLSVATGEIVGWLNSDDLYTECSFEKVVEAFASSPDVVLVHGNRILLDEDSQVSGWGLLPAFDPEVTGYVIASETAFWRRSGTESIGFDEELHLAMDQDFFCRLYNVGKLVKVNAFLGYFRCYGANKTASMQHTNGDEVETAWKRNFGESHRGWLKRAQHNRAQLWMALLSHPRMIALPYLYRRFVLGRRGL